MEIPPTGNRSSDDECFDVLDAGTNPPSDYEKIPILWTFDVKFDGRFRARCVAGGHMTSDQVADLYSGVVDLETVRIAFVIAVKRKRAK